MHMHEVYLDWAATALPDPLAVKLQHDTSLECYGNPSSPHSAGGKAHDLLENARNILAVQLDCRSDELYFTSGATEANNMMLFSLVKRALILKKDFTSYTIIISALEHSSLWEPALVLKRLGFKVKVIYPDSRGMIEADTLAQALDGQTVMVIIMLVNNETGAVQPVSELAEKVKTSSRNSGRKIIFHCDIVQAFGKIPVSLRELAVDSACVSAHKLGAGKGIGALYLNKQLDIDFLYSGGYQEMSRRPGTENVPGIYSFAKTAEKKQHTLEDNLKHARRLMDYLIAEIQKLPHAVILPAARSAGHTAYYSPYILPMAFPPLAAEVVVRVLNGHNIFIATGSACHSHNKERTRVLESMGIPDRLTASSVRVSTGPETTQEHIDSFLSAVRAGILPLQQQLASNQHNTVKGSGS
jgi:cysteine desulfurase